VVVTPSIHLNPPSGTAAAPVTVESLLIDVGTSSRDETFGLGVQLLDPITVPKTFTRLAGTRVAGRSMDDRFGCAALVALTQGIEPRDVHGTLTIAWSVQEELGLIGAEALAREFSPDVVIPVDTYVTSDSPIEDKRIGNAALGDGPIIRALDRSNVAPIALVRSVLAFAERNGLELRYGATGGGNDGSVFRTGNSSVLPLAIPLRYAHTAVETIDTQDLAGLVRLLRAMVRDVSWIQ
jgi:putative aminopeptidase